MCLVVGMLFELKNSAAAIGIEPMDVPVSKVIRQS